MSPELPGVLQEIAAVAGEDAARRIGERLAGQAIKFPALESLQRPRRDAAIRRAHQEGATVAALAGRWGLTPRRIRQIIESDCPASPQKSA